MADQAESSRRAQPMTPPPSPTLPQDEAMLWPTPDSSSSSTPHTDLLSLWLSNYPALPQFEVEEEPVADVPTLLNFDLDSSFLDLVDWKTTSTAATQAPVVTEPLWVQLDAPATGEVDDLSRLALGLQSPEASILPPAFRIQDPEAFVSPLALGMYPPPASSEIVAPQASLPPLALGFQSPPASFGIQPPQAPISPLAPGTESFILPLARGIIQLPEASMSPPISPLALGIQAPQISLGILSPQISFSSLPPIPGTLPMAPPLWNLPPIPCPLPMAPPLWNLPSNSPMPGMPPPLWNLPPMPYTLAMPPPLWNLPPIPCTLPMPTPLWNLPSIPCTLPMAPPSWNFSQPSSSPVPERRNWSVLPSTSPPAQRQLLLPQLASASAISPSSHPSHPPHHFEFFPEGCRQQHVPVAPAPVTFSTPSASASASANFSAGFVPTSRPPWSQTMAPRRSWTSNQPWIGSGQDMKLPIPRRPRFLLPSPPAAAMMPAPSVPLPLANFRSSLGNTPNWNARGDVPVEDHQQVQTGESSRPRKKSKLALNPSGSEALHWSHNGAQVAFLAPKPALNRDGKVRALPGTATDSQSLFSRYQREKVKQCIKTLQKLVPNGDKADTAILFEQAHGYIRFLEHQIKFLQSNVDWKLAAPFVSDVDHPQ